MRKPNWLKSSVIKYYLNKIFFCIISYFIYKNKNKKSCILVTELDGIGDVVIRINLLEIIAKKYGKENLLILTKNAEEILELKGYNYIKAEKNFHMSAFKLLKLYKKMIKYNFSDLYMLEFKKDKEVDFLMKFNFNKVYAYENNEMEKWKKKYNLKMIPKEGERILDSVYNFSKHIDKNINKDDVIPKLHIPVREQDYIAVGIGAGGDFKVSSPIKMAEFLNYILKVNPKSKFYIFGNGKNQENYFKDLEKLVNKDSLINYVGKLSLLETIKKISNAKLYIGFDSGLYNIAYSLDKKILAIVSMKNSQSCYHISDNIKFVYRREEDEGLLEIKDFRYTNEDLNQIPLKRFEKEYSSLEIS